MTRQKANLTRNKPNANSESSFLQSRQPQPKCPECRSRRLFKDGLRYLKGSGTVQRWLCRDCGYRFSDPNQKKNCNRSDVSQHGDRIQRLNLKTVDTLTYSCQVSARRQSGAKNLVKVVTRQGKAQREGTAQRADSKGKIIEFLWRLKKQGLSEATIKTYKNALETLVKNGSDLRDPESVKEALARCQGLSNATKHIVIAAYSKFLEIQGGSWKPPVCYVSRKLPFIPLEREIDDLIAGSGKKTATFLQLLKETAMRAGEALRLKWADIDFERHLITLNAPEKRGNPRVFNISSKLIGMLNILPKKSDRVFNCRFTSMKGNFIVAKKRLAKKLGNPRLRRITYHTLRHWKATMTYHKTKDSLYVKEMLGHKSLNTTLLYIQLDKALFSGGRDEFHVKVAEKPEEIKELLEVGFEYVCKKDGLMFFRKRKITP